MPYLNIDINYEEHPKTRRLMMRLGPDADVIPIRLWLLAGKLHAGNGFLKNYTDRELADAIRWRGGPDKLVKNLIAAGFIARRKNGFSIKDWHQHQGHLEAFSRRGKVAAKARWDKYASSMHKASVSNAYAMPLPNRTEPYRTEPTEPTEPNRNEALEPQTAKDAEATNTTADSVIQAKGGQTATAPASEFVGKPTAQEAEAERKLLALRWNIRGDHYGVTIGNLSPTYAEWALNNVRKLGVEYKLALQIVLNRRVS